MKLSVIVSIYNSGQWIKNRLDNLMGCDIPLDVICINADSPDPLDHEIPQQYPVRYVKLDKRITVYEAWNVAIGMAKGEYLVTANTDDLIAPHGYRRLIEVLEGSGSDFAYPSWFTTGKANQKWAELTEASGDGHPGHYNGNLEVGGVGHFPLWKKELHDRFGLFDPSFRALGDADWWARCFWLGSAKFTWTRELLGCYLWRNGENLWSREINGDEWGRYHERVAQYKAGENCCKPTRE